MDRMVDISTFDRTINFTKVKKSGIVGVIIRAGYADEVDAYFYEHIKGAIKAGLPVGIYWFSYAYTVDMAKKEAQKCIETIKPYKISLPVYYDFEYASDDYAEGKGHPVSDLTLNQMAVAFCSEIRKAGYVPGIYFNKDYRDSRFDKNVLKSYSQWYAYYNKTLDSGAKDIDLWQYTSEGEVDGIPEPKEDLDYVVNENLILLKSEPVQAIEEKEIEKYTAMLQIALNTSYGLSMPVDGKFLKLTKAACNLYYLYYKTPTIKNAHVSFIQEMLCKAGHMTAIDGSYGKDTRKTVMAFQKKQGLIVDGWCGEKTTRKLIEVNGHE